MAYVYPWNNAVPAGTDPANQLDTYITDLKSALTERFEDKLVQSMAADPWVLKPEVLGNVTGKVFVFHWSDLVLDPEFSGGGALVLTNKSIRNDDTTDNRDFWLPIRLPTGVTITEFRIFAAKGSNNTTANLRYGSYDATFTEVSVSLLTQTSATFGEVSQTGLTQVVDTATQVYFVKITLGRNAGTFGYGKIVYTTPDCRNTL